jgi:hypothetical protein
MLKKNLIAGSAPMKRSADLGRKALGLRVGSILSRNRASPPADRLS